MVARDMDKIRLKLNERLTAKGLESNEIELFIKDVIRVEAGSQGQNLETINGQLQVLGWQNDCADYGIIQLIQACYQDA